MTSDLEHRPSAARLTAGGRGAIAVIRVSHTAVDWNLPKNVFLAANQLTWDQQPVGRLIYGRWGSVAAEDVVLCRISRDAFEIQCHGGDAAVSRILDDLARLGIENVQASEQLRCGTDFLEVELQTALSQALTWRTADLINEQARGLLRSECEALLRHVRDDVSEPRLRQRLDDLLCWSAFGLHLTQPWNVVLTGRPNVGKSSLINTLLGYRRALVSDQPGTTRDVVVSVTAFDGWPVQLSDTAGLRTATEDLEAAGIARARQRLLAADLRLIVLDTGEPPHADDLELLKTWPDAIVVAHKSDQPDRWGKATPAAAVRVSSLTGDGVPQLEQTLGQRLVSRVPPAGTPVPLTPRQVDCLRDARHAVEAGDPTSCQTAIERLLTG